MTRNPLLSIAFVAALLVASSCEERPSSDASVDVETEQTGTIEGTAPADQVDVDADPTPQTGTGGSIPETEEGSSQ